MEKDNSEYLELINFINLMYKKSMKEPVTIGIENYGDNTFYYGEKQYGELLGDNSIEITDVDNFSQNIFNSIVSISSDNLSYGYSHGMFGDDELSIIIDNLTVVFPTGSKFMNWNCKTRSLLAKKRAISKK